MPTIPFPLIIIIFAVQAIRCDLQCDVPEQLDNTCGTYCLQVVKPLLSHAKASLERPDDKIDQVLTKFESMVKRLDKVESMEKRLDKVDQILTKIESVEKRLDKVDQIVSKVESMEKRLDGYEQYFHDLKLQTKILLDYLGFRKIDYHYYYISTSREPFSEAKKKCNQFGADLVSFQSSSELELVTKHLTAEHYWSDLKDVHHTGSFLSTTPYVWPSFRWWDDGEPSGDGFCVELKLVDKVYRMNDVDCEYAREFICELNSYFVS